MTNTTEKQITIIDAAPEHWGDRKEIASVARRIKALLPGQKMTDDQAMALAQYARLVDANPFRGEIYMLPNGQIVDGYKLLIRWARGKAPFSEKYSELTESEKVTEGITAVDIAYRCLILRDDKKNMLLTLVQAGASFQEAYDLVATSSIGVVTAKDRNGRNGEIPPPKGWTWAQVARKRALKNALNMSHGAPSPQELAKASWQVGPTQTKVDDWQEISADLPPDARDRAARFAAIGREVLEAAETMTSEEKQARRQHNDELLHPNQDEELDEGYDDYAEEDIPIKKHWSEETKNRIDIEGLLAKNGIPFDALLNACKIEKWEDLSDLDLTGQEVFNLSRDWWVNHSVPANTKKELDEIEPAASEDEIPF